MGEPSEAFSQTLSISEPWEAFSQTLSISEPWEAFSQTLSWVFGARNHHAALARALVALLLDKSAVL